MPYGFIGFRKPVRCVSIFGLVIVFFMGREKCTVLITNLWGDVVFDKVLKKVTIMVADHILYHTQNVDWRIREILKPVLGIVHWKYTNDYLLDIGLVPVSYVFL